MQIPNFIRKIDFQKNENKLFFEEKIFQDDRAQANGENTERLDEAIELAKKFAETAIA